MIERNLAERYRLEGRIGQGGMAVVYAGIDTVLRRRVAIKVLRPELAADKDFVARFYTEAQHAAKLSHPNIVNIYDVGREGESYFIVMELVEGATLAEMIESDTRLPEPVAIDFAAQICSGLAYAHRQGLLHRDVKPANILVTKDDVVKISDFGIARAVTTQTMSMTQAGIVMGSVFYVSPEQAQGHELHETSDLYSLGIVLYQMLTGHLPYAGESPIAIALKHVSAPVPHVDADEPSVSPALAAIVRKLMQKDPADRFPSAVAVATALREAREHPLVTTPFDIAPNGERVVVPGPQTIPNPKPRPSPAPDRGPRRGAANEAAAVADTPTRGLRTFATVVATLVALAFAIVLGYVVTSRPGGLFGATSSIALPNLIGQTASDAEAALDKLGLRYALVPVASDSVAAGSVVKQDPDASAKIAGGGTVQLYVSTGLPTVSLMDVRHYSIDDAQRYLRNAKLVPQIVGKYDPSPRGTVLAQNPAEGASVPIHSRVQLIVSKGPQPVPVPDVVSMTVEDATAALAQRHLKLVVSERDPNDQIPANTIVSQNTQPGAGVDPNSEVDVDVSSGPPEIVVPDLGGHVVDDASTAIANAGLQPNIEYVVDQTAPLGTVMKQTPDAGTSVKKGDSVTIDVAVPGIVPDVAGKSTSDATSILQNAGYKIGNSSYVQEGADGTIARTEPVAGSALRPGETVTLFVNGVSKEGQ
jgi:beta-lactam-binding protein with PASTA domain/tRNA A-37 threonylcarbamoyl transferase component Bud32